MSIGVTADTRATRSLGPRPGIGNPDPVRRAWKRSTLVLIERYHIAVIGILLVGFVATYAAMLWKLRADTWDRAMMAADNVLVSLEDDVARSVDSYEDTFEILALQLRNAEHNTLAGGHEKVALQSLATLVRTTGDLFLFDETGAIQVRTSHFNAHEALKHRDFLVDDQAGSGGQVRISSPFRDPATGNTVLWLSRRLEKADGSFAGIIAGTLDTGRWRSTFQNYALGPKSAINLFHADGTMVMRAPFMAARIGTSFAGTDNFRRFSAAKEGSFVAPAVIDHEERAYRFKHVENTPFILNVATSLDDLYAEWRRGALISGAVVLALAAMTIALRLILTRELRLRRESEARYRAMSNIDGLTGIANRRRFDEALAKEWQRACSSKSALSVILLDVDHFKRFNDVYGHQAGDECLRRVAAVVRSVAVRSSDLVARYGGEEFVVLLPDTSAEGALVIAERIRAAVAAEALPHEGNPEAGVVTVSLGTATHAAGSSDILTPAILVSAADQALYRAKRNGRNRVEQQAATSTASMPPILENEVDRLSTLQRFAEAGGTTRRSEFDDLAALAAGLLEAPVALVSVIGADRQNVIGEVGLEVDGASRDISFCSHAIAGNGIFVVPDASRDPRFASNPFVTGELNLRFYAGAPVVDPETGHALGAVCVVDTRPREGITAVQERVLTSMADLAMQRISNMATSGSSLPARNASVRSTLAAEPTTPPAC